jgi:hypothetical protein
MLRLVQRHLCHPLHVVRQSHSIYWRSSGGSGSSSLTTSALSLVAWRAISTYQTPLQPNARYQQLHQPKAKQQLQDKPLVVKSSSRSRRTAARAAARLAEKANKANKANNNTQAADQATDQATTTTTTTTATTITIPIPMTPPPPPPSFEDVSQITHQTFRDAIKPLSLSDVPLGQWLASVLVEPQAQQHDTQSLLPLLPVTPPQAVADIEQTLVQAFDVRFLFDNTVAHPVPDWFLQGQTIIEALSSRHISITHPTLPPILRSKLNSISDEQVAVAGIRLGVLHLLRAPYQALLFVDATQLRDLVTGSFSAFIGGISLLLVCDVQHKTYNNKNNNNNNNKSNNNNKTRSWVDPSACRYHRDRILQRS